MRGAGRVAAAQQRQRRPTQCVPSVGQCSGPASCSHSAKRQRLRNDWSAGPACPAGFWPEGKEGRGRETDPGENHARRI